MRLRLMPEAGYDLAAGMSVNVTIEYAEDGQALMELPLSALMEQDGQAAVWVFVPESKTVTCREVGVKEILKDGRVVVESGVAPGEIVVTAGVHKLKEGAKVDLLKPVSRTNIGGLL